MKKVILDSGVFRKLVKPRSSEEVQGLLKIINQLIPLRLVSTFGLWSEYVGLSRPPFRHPEGMDLFKSANDIEHIISIQDQAFEILFASYKEDPLLSPSFLDENHKKFFEYRVSKNIPQAIDTAEDIILFKGQDFNGKPFSWDALANQLCIDLTIDEILYQIRYFPITKVDFIAAFMRQTINLLKKYHHLPIYRMADSVIDYLWNLHTKLPDHTNEKAKKSIYLSRKGMSQLAEAEFGDCTFIWTAIQGLCDSEGLNPVTVITFDKQSRRRAENLLDLLKAEVLGQCLLRILQDSNHLVPGRILILEQSTYRILDEIDVSKLIN